MPRAQSRGDDSTLEILPLTPARWPDLVGLFAVSGAYSNCWCTWWRQSAADFDRGCRNRGAGNRELLESLTAEGSVPGLLAYRDGDPVGWVSVSPRTEYGRVLRSPMLRPEDEPRAAEDPGTWSVVCFWIPRAERGRGLGTALLSAAVAHARKNGARVLEGYPVDTSGERAVSSSLFTGTLGMFLGAGFRESFRRRDQRPVVRRTL